jgi:DNA polymerase-3 subunit epsilon
VTSLTAIIDFETTGLSPTQGDRATEVAIVLMERGQVVDRFQSLMNAGVRISAFIEAYTGISNAMIASAPPARTVMADASRFVGDAPMVAHNASFDRRFWAAELARLQDDTRDTDASPPSNMHAPYACTLLLSRRLYPEAPNHKLGSLAAFHGLPQTGRAHRALADAEMAAELLTRIRVDLARRHGVDNAGHDLLMRLQAAPRQKLPSVIASYAT